MLFDDVHNSSLKSMRSSNSESFTYELSVTDSSSELLLYELATIDSSTCILDVTIIGLGFSLSGEKLTVLIIGLGVTIVGLEFNP